MNTRSRAGKKIIYLIVIGAAIGFGTYGFFIEPNHLEVRNLRIEGNGFSEILKGKTAIHLSDIHIGDLGQRETEIFRIIDEVKPDFIFLTGDYIKWKGDNEAALNFLSRLKAKIAIWAVMGDYDYSNSRNSCLFCHEKGSGKRTRRHQVRFLRNTVEKLNVQNGSIWIGGLDTEGDETLFPAERFLTSKMKGPAIILSHNPLNFDLIAEEQNVLMLAGDTHGGQIPLPSWIWEMFGYEKCARYAQGFFQQGRKSMFVSRGIGTSHFPFRLFRRPEVVILHF